LFADAKRHEAYQGYRYRILTRQGERARGGAQDYLNEANMNGGFAIVAWPADYGQTGVMSFMLNREGVVYEADLGPTGGEIASSMPAFDPDLRWSRVDPVAEEAARLLR
jgi:hypothetical protein